MRSRRTSCGLADERATADAVRHPEPVTGQHRKPWAARARALVLYCPTDQWRYAIYNDEGIIDGALLDVSPDADPADAQATLLRKVEEITGLHYAANWKQDKPRWWSAALEEVGA